MTKFAILGYGFMGKKHHDAIKAKDDASVVAIIDNCNIHHPETECFQSLDVFLEQKPDVDRVIIATPNYDHSISAQRLLENGYDIFLEKPYCLSKKDAETLQTLSNQLGRKIFFSHQNRYSSISKFLKTLISEQKLGKIYMLQSNLFWSRGQNYYQPNSWKGKKATDGGTLYTQFFHFIDLIMWLFGDIEIKNVLAKTLKHQQYIEIEDTGTIAFEIKDNGAIGVLNFSTAVYEKNLESSMTIIAEKGTIKISGQYFDEIEYCNIENFAPPLELPKSDNISNLMENLTSEECHPEDVKQSFKTVEKIEEIYRLASEQNP